MVEVISTYDAAALFLVPVHTWIKEHPSIQTHVVHTHKHTHVQRDPFTRFSFLPSFRTNKLQKQANKTNIGFTHLLMMIPLIPCQP